MVKKILISGIASFALAEQGMVLADIKTDLADIGKVATQTRKNITYLPYIMSVFENKELREVGAGTLKDALELVAGVEMSTDSLGMINPVFRGSNPYAFGQSKLIIDGSEVNDLYFGGYTPYLSMPVELIKRVEVIRGPGAYAKGSNGYAGSIIVTTYKEQIDKPNFSSQLFAGYGSNAEKRVGGSYNYAKDDFVLHLDAYTLRDDKKLLYGMDIAGLGVYGAANVPLGRSGYAPTKTETESLAISLANKNFFLNARAIGYKHGAGGGISYALTQGDDNYELPRYDINGGYKYNIVGTEGVLKASVFEDSFIIDSMTAPAGMMLSGVTYPNGLYRYAEVAIKRYSIENSFESEVFGGLLSYGIRGRWEKAIEQETLMTNRGTGIGTTDYSNTLPAFNKDGYVSSIGGYIEYDKELTDYLALNAALSVDKRNKNGAAWEPRVSFVYLMSGQDRLKFFVSKSHRDPSWQELFIMNNQSRIGNTELRPEVVYAYETQYIHQFSQNNTFSFDLFYLQNYDQINKLSGNKYQNIGKSKIAGCETEWRAKTDALTFYVGHTYQWGEDGDGRRLANTANHTLKTHAIYNFDNGFWGSAAWRYSGSKIRENGDTRDKLDGWQTTDLSIGYKIKPYKAELQITAKNIFDQKIKYPSEPRTYNDDYPGDTRGIYATLRGRF